MSTDLLLEVIKGHAVLYDPNHPDYKDIRKKDKVWLEIGEALSENGDAVKNRWKNLRDSYAKYLKCSEATTSESAKRYKHWRWANQMEAFKPYLTFSKSESTNLHKKILDTIQKDPLSQDDGPVVSNETLEIIKKYQNRKEKINSVENRAPSSPIKRKKPRRVQKKTQRFRHQGIRYDHDATELIMLGYAKTIKTFSLERQASSKLKIAEIIMRQEIEQQREQQQILNCFPYGDVQPKTRSESSCSIVCVESPLATEESTIVYEYTM